MLPSPDILNEFEGGKFVLSNLAAKRAKQLQEGAVPLVQIESKHPLTIALAEIAAKKVRAILPEGPTLPIDNIDLPPVEIMRAAEFNVLLPALEDIDAGLLGLEEEDEHDFEPEIEAETSATISDLVAEDEAEVEEIVPESDTLSLTELQSQEAFEEDEIEV